MPESAPELASKADVPAQPEVREPTQRSLFTQPLADKRVIPFDSLTSAAERESIRARAAEVVRPAPLKTGKVELPRAKTSKRRVREEQGSFEFLGQSEAIQAPQPSIICDAPVAPPRLRLQSAALDGCAIAAGWLVIIALFKAVGGEITADKHLLPIFLLVLATVPLLYKLLWTFAGRDTPGMRASGIRLIDFDGNPPSRERRYYRAFGSILSLLAAGMGLVWIFVDEDQLTWQDHISGTFPTAE